MKRILAAAAIAALAAAPTAAFAASYYALSIDKKTLVMTDLKLPRLTNGLGEAYAIVINRAPVKAKKKVVHYSINKLEFDCAKAKARQAYTAAYNDTGDFVSSDVNPKGWAKMKPASNEQTLSNLACLGVKPSGGFPIGDQLLRKVMQDYRTGAYDRFIH